MSIPFYYKLNQKIDDLAAQSTPVGSVLAMATGIDSDIYKPSGDVIDTNDYPLLNALLVSSGSYYRALESTQFSLTGSVPFTQIACSPDLIMCVGENSKIYTSTDGESWTSYDCPAAGGAFSGSYFLDYAGSPVNKFYITHRSTNYYSETVYLSTDGSSWNSYTGCGENVGYPSVGSSYSRYCRYLNKWYKFFWYGVQVCNNPPTCSPLVTYTYVGLSTKTDITSGTNWSSIVQTDVTGYIPPFYYDGLLVWAQSTSTFISQYVNTATHYRNVLPVVNGSYQPYILTQYGYYTSNGVNLYGYATGFSFPSSSTIIAYDIANNRYMAVNPTTNQFYTSANGLDWSAAATITAGSYTLNGIGIRHNQSRFVAVGTDVKTTVDNGANWVDQTLLTLGGNFTDVATDDSGITVISSLNSSVVSRATTGTNFDLVNITDSSDWQNVHWDGSKFILSSRTRQLKTSTDGETWTTQSAHAAFTNTAHYITSMCNISTNYCAISSSSVDTLTSSNGTSWTKRASTVPTGLLSICGATLPDGTNRMVAVGTNICYTSDDYGVTALSSRSIGTGVWNHVIYAGGRFVCVSSSTYTQLVYSYDGITWVAVTTPFQPYSFAYVDGLYVIIGQYYLTVTDDLENFGLSQPIATSVAGRCSVYDETNNKMICANVTSISYADATSTKIRLLYMTSTDSGITNYIKVA